MSQSLEIPPAVLDCARVLAYATVGPDVRFTGRCGMYVDGKPLGQVEKLAICRNLSDGDLLLLYCDLEWESMAAAGYPTVEDAKASAERAYAGIHSKWCERSASEAEVTAYLDEHWPSCSFCCKRGFEVALMFGDEPRICSDCIKRFDGILESRAT